MSLKSFEVEFILYALWPFDFEQLFDQYKPDFKKSKATKLNEKIDQQN